MATTSRRPYLLRAIYEWALENGLTPHIVVTADAPGVDVPQQYVQDGKITLNISAQAAKDLSIGDTNVLFSARFGGQTKQITAPVSAILAIYARENGEGIVFGEVETGGPPSEPTTPAPPKRGRPQLKLVK